MNTDQLVELTCALIARESVTPADAGCQSLIAAELEAVGFQLRQMPFGSVENLWATHGEGAPLLVFAGHTDVVPPGNLEDWETPPFQPTIKDGMLYGRGAADMKASLAAMVGAAKMFAEQVPDHPGTLAFLITSDEEGPAIHGTRAVVEALGQGGVVMDYCVVGEPSSSEKLGDVVRNGRRGSLNAELVIDGVQGHVAYPSLVDNPIHYAAQVLNRILAIDWDTGNDYFPPTSLQISNINSGTGATNVVPGKLSALFNLRFNTEQTATGIEERVNAALADIKSTDTDCTWHINWTLSGNPFLTPKGDLTHAVSRAIESNCGYAPELSTSGGTSDGRFIAPTGTQVTELGPCNATIHKINECVAVADLEVLQHIYLDIARILLMEATPHKSS